jgi:hypothetical protein
VLVLDAGASFAPLQHAEPWSEGSRGLEQRRRKAALIAEAYALAGMDGLALGGNDWALGPSFLWTMLAEHRLPVLAANLKCQEDVPTQPGRVVDVGGKRVALVGVTEGEVEGCQVEDPVGSAAAALEALGPVDLSIGLVPFRSSAQVAAMGAVGFDVIVDGRGRHTLGNVERAESTLLYGAGSRGKHVGVLEATWTASAERWTPEGARASLEEKVERTGKRIQQLEERLALEEEPLRVARIEAQRTAYESQVKQAQVELDQLGNQRSNRLLYREVPLSRDVMDHGATATMVGDALKGMLEAEGAPIRYHLEPHVALEKSPYAGSDVCVGCHQTQHAQWSTTRHAHAWQTLVMEQRHLDQDCFGCHSTAAGQRGGVSEPSKVVGMRDVQCEACHGPAKAHTKRPMSVRPVGVPDLATCTRCHDGDRDGGRFDADTYWPKVDHSTGKPPRD